MDSETEEIKAKWIWIFQSIRTAWRRIAAWDDAIHQRLHAQHPRLTRFLGGSLRFVYEMSTHPSFAVLVAFLLVGLVISDSIGIIVSLSAFFSWLITVLWVGHSKPVERLNIVHKVLVVAAFGATAGICANWYTHWCITQYASKHPVEKPTAVGSVTSAPTKTKHSADDEQLITSLKQSLAQALSIRRAPSSPQILQTPPEEKRARLVFSFFQLNMAGEPQTVKLDPISDDKFSASITAVVKGDVPAENLEIWIRECKTCEWVGPSSGLNPGDADHPFDRGSFLAELQPNVSMPRMDISIKVPHYPTYDSVAIGCYYSCKNCAPVDWSKPQILWVAKTLQSGFKLRYPSISYIPEPGKK